MIQQFPSQAQTLGKLGPHISSMLLATLLLTNAGHHNVHPQKEQRNCDMVLKWNTIQQ